MSPVLDLVHFIFSCTDEDLRANHYDDLLKIYHESLRELLDRLGGDTETQFPFSALQQQLKKFGSFGVFMASMMIPMLSVKNEDLPDMDVMAENMNKDPKAVEEMMAVMGKGNDFYKVRMLAVVMDSIRLGYL